MTSAAVQSLTTFGLGGIVGFTLALTGAGGGVLAVPLLLFALHLGVAEAAPVGLLAVGLAAALGALLGLKDGKVRYRAAALMGAAGMAAAPVGVSLAQRLPNRPLVLAFSGVLAWSALRMYRRSLQHHDLAAPDRRHCPCVCDERTGRLVWTGACARVLACTGLCSGLMSGLLGVGGGFVIVPALTRYSTIAADRIVCTSLAVIALVSVAAVGTAAAHGSMPWAVALPFSAGTMLALLWGRLWASRWSGPVLQRCFAFVSLAVAAMLLWRGLGLH